MRIFNAIENNEQHRIKNYHNTPRSLQISPSKNRSELFKMLDLKICASSIECKKAYTKLARHYHPDK